MSLAHCSSPTPARRPVHLATIFSAAVRSTISVRRSALILAQFGCVTCVRARQKLLGCLTFGLYSFAACSALPSASYISRCPASCEVTVRLFFERHRTDVAHMRRAAVTARKRRLLSQACVQCAVPRRSSHSLARRFHSHFMSAALPSVTVESASSSPCPIWPCSPTSPPSTHPALLEPAISHLRSGHVVGMPTETVYGLAGSAFSTAAIQLIFAAKGRPSDNPLIVHSHGIAAVEQFCRPLTATQRRIAEAFWPGPLTLLLTPRPDSPLSPLVTAGQPTVGVRVPDHPVALSLLRLSGLPLAAPSANLSGRPSPTTAAHVLHDLGSGRGLSGIIDGGDTQVGLESSVVHCIESVTQAGGEHSVDLHILRPGAITAEHFHKLLPHARIHSASHTTLTATEAPLAPGMKYTHYKPSAAVVLLDGSLQWRSDRVDQLQQRAKRVGVISTAEERHWWEQQRYRRGWAEDAVVPWAASSTGVEGLAAGLFGALRGLDAAGVDVIVVQVVDSTGLGEAVMNRLTKAAGGEVWREGSSSNEERRLHGLNGSEHTVTNGD